MNKSGIFAAESPSVIIATPDRIIGDESAPIVIYEYSSLTCDHCAKFHLEILPYLKKYYIDPGYIKIVFREYASDGLALRAFAICNMVPEEEYFNILELFYVKQKEWIQAKNFVEKMAQIAKYFGLKRHQVNSCIENETLLSSIVEKRIEATRQYKIDRTPFFVVNGKKYPYFMDKEEWTILLQPLIQKVKSSEESA
jgi:protein-disulfide isomerase